MMTDGQAEESSTTRTVTSVAAEIRLQPLSSTSTPLALTSVRKDARNVVKGGSCEDFIQQTKSTGVFDSKGKNHPGFGGYAELIPNIGTFDPPAPTAGVKNMWECPKARGIFYTSQAECESVAPCRVTLASPHGCGGKLMKSSTVEAKFPVQGKILISVRLWKPKNPSPQCAAAIAAYDAAMLAHENRHRDDALAILQKAKSSPAKSYTAYGDTQEEANIELRKDLFEAMATLLEQIDSDYQKSVDAFHATDVGQTIYMDCGACQ